MRVLMNLLATLIHSRISTKVSLLATAFVAAFLIGTCSKVDAHESNGFWHNTKGVFDIVSVRQHEMGLSLWQLDHGGPYINLDPDVRPRYDEEVVLIFTHNQLHYYAPQLLYNRDRR